MKRRPYLQFIAGLGLSSAVSFGLFGYGALRNHELTYSYLLWNLFLAWLPLVFVYWLNRTLARKDWASWEALSATALWLVFLPNSFYMISDYIHLRDAMRVDILFDALMFTSFIFTGVVLGFASLYVVHLQLRKRLSRPAALVWIGAVLFICSIAVYVGRDLRWNSWDILTNPGGLLFDVTDRLGHPASYPQMLLTIAVFFILLSSMYTLALQGIRVARALDEPRG